MGVRNTGGILRMFRAMRPGDSFFIRKLVTVIVDIEVLPAVEGGLVIVVHVCIHIVLDWGCMV